MGSRVGSAVFGGLQLGLGLQCWAQGIEVLGQTVTIIVILLPQ